MYPHHTATIERALAYFRKDAEVSAILLAGSLAHGFATETSDVDVLVVVSDAERARRAASGRLAFSSFELATYPGGYVDAKYVSPGFLDAVEQRGSEPARFAFAHAEVLWAEIPDLPAQLERIARYPLTEKEQRMQRFRAQLEAWHWYTSQAALRRDDYLMNLAVAKLVLFGGRLVLAHNELLYPYHKWFLRVLERAPDKPAGFIDAIQSLSREPSAAKATQFFQLVDGFRSWPAADRAWPERFLADTELTWLDGSVSIDDL